MFVSVQGKLCNGVQETANFGYNSYFFSFSIHMAKDSLVQWAYKISVVKYHTLILADILE